MRNSCKAVVLATLALSVLAACGVPPARAPATPQPAAAPRGAAYRIDPAHSELRLLVYRAGVMAALGHDHVVVNRVLDGWVSPAAGHADAAFFLNIPTSGFVVDEAAARAEEGAEFSEAIGEDARAGTLRNMLSPAVLDAQSHPSITVQSISIERLAGGAPVSPSAEQVLPGQVTVRISVAGHESNLDVPFTVEMAADRLHAHAVFTLRQTALGLTPFNALLGALRVDDLVRVKLDLLAIRE